MFCCYTVASFVPIIYTGAPLPHYTPYPEAFLEKCYQFSFFEVLFKIHRQLSRFCIEFVNIYKVLEIKVTVNVFFQNSNNLTSNSIEENKQRQTTKR